MSMNEACDVFEGARISVATLRAIVFGNQAGLSRSAAVMLLGERRYPKRVADLRRLLESPSELPRIRAVAAQQLALVATPAAITALRKGLKEKDGVTLRAVVNGVAWAGDLASLPAVDRIARRRGPASSAATWAALLLRFRYGKSGGAPPSRGRILRPDPHRSVTVQVRQAPTASIAAALRSLKASAPSFRLTGRHAVGFTCGERRVMVLLDAASEREGWANELLTRRALAGVVVEQLPHVDDSWELSDLLLTEPRRGRRLRIAVVAPNGQRVLEGEAVGASDGFAFQLAAIESPGAVPTTVVGSLTGGRLRLQQVLVGTVRHPPMRPTLLPADDQPAITHLI
jgi:hypothetical protein